MTLCDEDPLEALRKGLDETLFLKFRSKCKFLHRLETQVVGGLNYCSHEENRWIDIVNHRHDGVQGHVQVNTGKWLDQEPPCAMGGCPIYERLATFAYPELITLDLGKDMLLKEFDRRWYLYG